MNDSEKMSSLGLLDNYNSNNGTSENDLSLEVKKMLTSGVLDYDEDFTCSVCLNLMVEPTTLSCGHNICRVCLAHWFFTSRKKVCPTCREQWQGHPKVNSGLKNIILKLHPNQLFKRVQEVNQQSDTKVILHKFDKILGEEQKQIQAGQVPGRRGAFFSGIAFAFGVVVVSYLAWYWQSSEADLLVRKPLMTWRTSDVVLWLNSIEWARNYSNQAQVNRIDGYMLMGMDDNSLIHLFNVTDAMHHSALQMAIHSLRETGLKLPATLWEYKALYPGRTLFLAYALKDFPRTAMFFLYLFYYEESFLPFLHLTTPLQWDPELQTYSHVAPEPTWSQLIVFWVFMLGMPYWMLAVFTWSMCDFHTYTLWPVLASCVMLTLLDTTFYADFVWRGHWRSWQLYLKSHFKELLTLLMFGTIWPLVPSFICDIFFYSALYLSPVQLLKSLIQRAHADH